MIKPSRPGRAGRFMCDPCRGRKDGKEVNFSLHITGILNFSALNLIRLFRVLSVKVAASVR